MRRDLQLTDEQYLALLYQIHQVVTHRSFKPEFEDSTTPGNKYTQSNCGLCNDHFGTKEMMLFPEQFPQRVSLKYRQGHHHCPFDRRPLEEDCSIGCFYHCRLFQRRQSRIPELIQAVELTIKWAKSRIKNNEDKS